MDPSQAAAAVIGWPEIFKIVLASGVVATLIGLVRDLFFRWRDRKRDAKYVAIGVIAKLDLYALQASKNVYGYFDHITSLDAHRDYQNWPTCNHPEIQISDSELKSLSAERASDLAWVSTEKALAREHLFIIHEEAYTPIDVYDHEAHVVGYFGYEAYILAEKLRKEYGLPAFGSRWGADETFPDLQDSWTKTKVEVARIRDRRKESAGQTENT